MNNPVQVHDLADRFRPLTPAEEVNAQAFLTDAWEELLFRAPGLPDRMAAGQVRVGLVRRVVTAMVLRVLRNPDGLRQFSSDDASFTRDSLVSAGLLFVGPDELDLLSAPGSAAATSAFTIRPGFQR